MLGSFLQQIYEELSLQNQTRFKVGDTILYVVEPELTEEPIAFYQFDVERWKKAASMENAGGLQVRIKLLDAFLKRADREAYGLPEVSFKSGEIAIIKGNERLSIPVASEQWHVTHFNEEALILQSDNEEVEPYFVTFADKINAMPLTEIALMAHGNEHVFENLLLANPMNQDEKRMLYFDHSTVWDREKKTFHVIADDGLLSQDGQSVLLHY